MRSRITSSTILLSACLIFQIAFAQQNTNAPRQSVSGTSPSFQRIVDECVSSDVESSCVKIERKIKTISIQVPEFKQGDEDTHVYVVSGVFQGGCSGSSTTQPDEYGLVEQTVEISEASADNNSCQYYLLVMNSKTLEPRVTLDLYEVKLVAFLSSLETAMHLGVRAATGQRSTNPLGSGLRNANRQYGEERLSIRGDNLTIDELLDAVYQNTGCIVNRETEGMVLASCP
jgi:hypothetical protein